MKQFKHYLLVTLLSMGIGAGTALFVAWYHGWLDEKEPAELAMVEETPAPQIRDQQPLVIEDTEEEKEIQIPDPYDDTKYVSQFVRIRTHKEIRAENYGVGTSKTVKILTHKGGEQLNVKDMRETIAAVLQRLPNIKSTPELKDLIFETFIVETGLGRENFAAAVKRYKNYGIAQFTMPTCKEVLKWLKTVRPDVHEQVMSFYNPKHDLKWNITHNIPFSIAMCAELYWRIIPDLNHNIGTLEKRAVAWKKYNSPLGLGTVNIYIKRVNNFHKKQQKLQKTNSDKNT